MPPKTVRHKTRVVGVRNYIDQETGEITPMKVISSESADFNFEKIWLGHILQALDCLGSKKIKVVTWLLENKDTKNIIIAPQRKIAELCQVSLPVVTQTIKVLVAADVIKMEQQGVYMLNPNVIFKGDNSKRMNVLIKYNNL